MAMKKGVTPWRYLGAAQRAPIMANGRPPGRPVTGYSTGYAEALQARYDDTYERLGTGLLGLGVGVQRVGFTIKLDPTFNLSATVAHHLAQKDDPLS